MSSASAAAGAERGERALIEDLGLALVREYLAKRKYKNTLDMLASELPFKPVPTTTTALAKNLGITKFVSKNSKAEHPYPTLLEIFADYMYNKFGRAEAAEGGAATTTAPAAAKHSTDRAPTKTSSSKLRTEDEEDLSRQLGRSSLTRPNSLLSSPAGSAAASRPGSGGAPPSKSLLSPSALSSLTSSAPASRTASRPDSGYSSSGASFVSSSGSGSGSGGIRPGSASRLGRPSSSSSSSSTSRRDDADLMLEEDIDFDEEEEQYDARAKATGGAGARSVSSTRGLGGGGGGGAAAAVAGASAIPTTPVPPSTPVSLEEAHRAKSLIFGSSHLTGTFTEPWLAQGFFFQGAEVTREVPSLAFGLVQAQGGPCGMLAVVQAYVVKELLYSGSNAAATPAQRYGLLSSAAPALHRALVHALAEILWLVGDQRLARVVTRAPSAGRAGGAAPGAARKMPFGNALFRPDGVTECMQVVELRSLEALRNFFAASLPVFMAPQGHGVVLFLYSVIFTRGVENIEKDRDENSSLIGAHSYCTQEMVNLALTGRARSNVFNGVQDLGGLVLRGIDSRAEIGFLSLFEHYENIAVGSHLKSPRLPIWVVCSESHYTILFGLDPALSTTVPPQGRFDLFYYDELARQREEIRLSIDVSKETPPQKDGDLEPPINECIRTKWGKNARVDWNGVEPIL